MLADMLRAATDTAGDAVADLVSLDPDPSVENIVGRWPARFASRSTERMDLTAIAWFHDIIAQFMRTAKAKTLSLAPEHQASEGRASWWSCRRRVEAAARFALPERTAAHPRHSCGMKRSR